MVMPTKMQLAIRSGDEVELTNDFGQVERTKARSEPWQLGDGTWVVLVEGRTGGYDLERINPVAGKVVMRSAREWAQEIAGPNGWDLECIAFADAARTIAAAMAEARRGALEEAEAAVVLRTEVIASGRTGILWPTSDLRAELMTVLAQIRALAGKP